MKLKRKTSSEGFTVVELMIAMVATAIFVMAVGAMLVYAWMGWRKNVTSVQMQRDTTLAMRVISREIRRTPLEDIAPGNGLTCVNSNGTTAISRSGRKLIMQVNADPAFTLVRDHVISFSSTTNANGAVSIKFDLDTGFDSSTSSAVVYSRN